MPNDAIYTHLKFLKSVANLLACDHCVVSQIQAKQNLLMTNKHSDITLQDFDNTWARNSQTKPLINELIKSYNG